MKESNLAKQLAKIKKKLSKPTPIKKSPIGIKKQPQATIHIKTEPRSAFFNVEYEAARRSLAGWK